MDVAGEQLWIVFRSSTESTSTKVVLREVGRCRATHEEAALVSVAEATSTGGPLIAVPEEQLVGRPVRLTIHASLQPPAAVE